ncbi:uncharacterized protein RHOBADRAFT_42671 [Rhodotorula graminis WP1]|uniref:Superoxide dismutase n=1 Tax=Rhodotorula graminis (strain WP1) TaxID=578459 RepID=A0A194SAB5_RHOGW|nr:uncharacterized protein RHOBADRAFT_42671 [Rhodotorula graminis WP1]KPV76341.1 hypothetical protein RHOBADRAFT_42671 [Rhodotorula graminis WP1]
MLRATARVMSSFNKIPAVLPKLPYEYNALEPSISATIMELHHSKHHATYVANFNKATEDLQAAAQAQDIRKQIALQAAIKFNGGGHINHSLFWENLAPSSNGGGQFPSSGPLADQLEAVATANQDPLLGYVPLIGIDMWEHAFYLDYKNVKQSYLDAIYNVINWKEAEKRLASA